MIHERIQEMRLIAGRKSGMDHSKFMEAFKCAADMRNWEKARLDGK